MNHDIADARQVIPGGVNSPVRAFKGLGIDPVYIERGEGKYLFDVVGNRYVDFCLSWGSLILGHAHPAIVVAVSQAVKKGTSFGAPTRLETSLARLIVGCVPSIERVRFVNSGTEAVMTAVRLARAFTGRDKILKFDGCYHGHSDGLLVAAGSGVAGLPAASSMGISKAVVADTLSIPFNDFETLQRIVECNADTLAAIIIEPVPANMGLIIPEQGYLSAVRELTRRFGILLIFDEVITGFRIGLGGAQERFKVFPDLTCLGKIIGGGFPVGAIGGRKDIMDQLAPDGPVYQAGTLSGNPVAMSAGITTIEYLMANEPLYARLEHLVDDFAGNWRKSSPLTINAIGSMFTIFATDALVRNFSDANKQDTSLFANFFRKCLVEGIYMPPSRFETAFISSQHREEDLAKVLSVFQNS